VELNNQQLLSCLKQLFSKLQTLHRVLPKISECSLMLVFQQVTDQFLTQELPSPLNLLAFQQIKDRQVEPLLFLMSRVSVQLKVLKVLYMITQENKSFAHHQKHSLMVRLLVKQLLLRFQQELL